MASLWEEEASRIGSSFTGGVVGEYIFAQTVDVPVEIGGPREIVARFVIERGAAGYQIDRAVRATSRAREMRDPIGVAVRSTLLVVDCLQRRRIEIEIRVIGHQETISLISHRACRDHSLRH